MKYGLDLASVGAAGDPRTMGELAYIAEESGWDGIFLEDYIVWQSHSDVPTYDPWITLAAMAMRTQQVRLGTMVTPIARRRPWKLAQEVVALDHLSKGRMILGIGLGDTGESIGMDSSFASFGELMDPKKRARLLDESLEIIVRVWGGAPFSFEGEFYEIHDIKILPKPVQLARALRWDGSCMYRQKSHWMRPEDVRALREGVIARRGTAAGYDITVGGVPRWEDEDQQRAYLEAMASEGVTWWHEYIPPDVGGFDVQRKMIEQGPLRIE